MSELSELGVRDSLVPLCRPRGRVGPVVAVGLFLCVAAGTGIVDLVAPVAAPRLFGQEGVAEEQRRAVARWRDGTRSRLVERDLAKTSRVRRAVLPAWSLALYGAFGYTGDQVVAGSDGWLFLRSRMAYPAGPADELVAESASLIASVVRRLRLLDIETLLVPVPEKSWTYPDTVPRGADPRPELHDALLRALAARGVAAADLIAVWKNEPGTAAFCRTDSHWSFEGARLAAQEIARLTGTWTQPDARVHRLAPFHAFTDAGDLLRLAGVDIASLQTPGLGRDYLDACGRGLHDVQVLVAHDAEGNALLEKRHAPDTAPVLLLGTSYSAWPEFENYLLHYSGDRIRVRAQGAGGPLWELQRWVREVLAGKATGGMPRIVVWEFPAAELLNKTRPLLGLGDILGPMPAPGLVRADSLSPHLRFGDGGSLRPGSLEVGAEWLSVALPRGSLRHPGDGAFSVRFRGRVTGAALLTSVQTDAYDVFARWNPGQGEIVLPVIDPRGTGVVRAAVRSPVDDGRLELESVELVTDLVAMEGAAPITVADVEAPPNGWRKELTLVPPLDRGAMLAVEVTGGGSVGPIEISAGDDLGEVALAGPWAFRGEACCLVVRLRAGTRRVTIEGVGGPPDGDLIEARWVVPVRR